MSWEPIDDLPEDTSALQAAMEPFEECDHEFNFGICIDCEEEDPDYDPTPYGVELVTDWADAPSNKGLAA
jgi:hypothetical protein